MEGGSIHLNQFPIPQGDWHHPELESRWAILRDVRRVITGALEVERAAKTIGSSLQGTVAVYVSPELATALKGVDVAELSITSGATIITAQTPAHAFILEDVDHVGVIVNPADGEKCQRCWRVLPEVARNEKGICFRCDEVVSAI